MSAFELITVTLYRQVVTRTPDRDTVTAGWKKVGTYNNARLYRRKPTFQRLEDGPGQDTVTPLVLSLPPSATPEINDLTRLPACPQTGGKSIIAQIQLCPGYSTGYQCQIETGAEVQERYKDLPK